MTRTPLILLRSENIQDFLESDGNHEKDLTSILADEIEAFVESNNGAPYDVFKHKDSASAHTPYFTENLLPLECSFPAASGVFSPRLRKTSITSEFSDPSESQPDDLKLPKDSGLCGQYFRTWDRRLQHVGEHFKHGRESQRFPTAKFLAGTKGNNDDEKSDKDSRDEHIAGDPSLQVRLVRPESVEKPKVFPDSGYEVDKALEELPTSGEEQSRVNFESRTCTPGQENTSPMLQIGIVREKWTKRNKTSSRSTTESQSPRESFLEALFLSSPVSDTLSPSNSGISSITHGSTNHSPRTTPPSSLRPQSTNTTSLCKRQHDDGTEEGNNRRCGKHPKHSKSKDGDGQSQTVQSGRRLCCPLHAFDPERYSKNSRTGKKYEVCNGPGWFNMHHLKQHLGGAASSVHKKIRCPRCKTPFDTLALVMEHQEITPEECAMSVSETNLDDISIESWARINREVSRKGYDQLPQDAKDPIEIWVSANIGDYAQNRPIDYRQSELRKWYMVWMILHPGTPVPNHPFYDNNPSFPMAKMEILIRVYREIIESKMFAGEMEPVSEDQIETLMNLLRKAVDVTAKTTTSPLASFRFQQTAIFPPRAEGFNNQFDFDFPSFQNEDNNTRDSSNISQQFSSTPNMPPRAQIQNEPDTIDEDRSAGRSILEKRNVRENEFESGQPGDEMIEGLEVGMQSSGIVNTAASSYFEFELPLTSNDSMTPVPNLDFYSVDPDSMLFDIGQHGFEGNWQYPGGP